MPEKFKFSVDQLFINGCIHTMRREDEIVEAMAVYEDKIVGIGANSEFTDIAAKEVIDLGGKTVLPGLIDTHMHLYEDYRNSKEIFLADIHSYEELCNALTEWKKNLEPNEWILGKHLHMERLAEKKFPTRDILDRVSSEIPIIIKSFCGHANILNSKALEISGIDENYVPEIPDTVDFYEDGRPNGIVREETYLYHVRNRIPEPTFEKAKEDIADYLKDCASKGLTTIHTNDISDPYKLDLFQEIRREQGLACRVVYYPTNITKNVLGAISGFGDDYIKMGAMKMFMDGSVGAASSAMKEPYADMDTTGILIQNQEETNRKMKEAYHAGMEIAIHAIGDRAIDMALTGFENAYDPEIGWKRRFYLIHGYIPDFKDMERMKKLPMVVITQPVFIRNFIGMARERLGEERTEKLFPNKEYIKQGILVTGSSDAPIQENNPFFGIQCAVTRKALNKDPEVIGKSQGISIYQAIDMYTRQAAYVAQEELKKGTLEAGKLADFIILDRNVFAVSPEEIYKTGVEATYVGGRKVYSGFQNSEEK